MEPCVSLLLIIASYHHVISYAASSHLNMFGLFFLSFSVTGISNFREFHLSTLQPPSSYKLGVILNFLVGLMKKNVFNTEAQNHLSKL